MPLSETLLDTYLDQHTLFVTAELPIIQYGWCVGKMTCHVRPKFDQAFNNPWRACEVYLEDDTGKRHALSDGDAAIVLGRIHDECPSTWAEIEAGAE